MVLVQVKVALYIAYIIHAHSHFHYRTILEKTPPKKENKNIDFY